MRTKEVLPATGIDFGTIGVMVLELAANRGAFKRDLVKTSELKLPTIPVPPFTSIASRNRLTPAFSAMPRLVTVLYLCHESDLA